jgi:hypothetical protein
MSHTHTHTRVVLQAVSSSLIRRPACARTQFSGCNSTTNVHSETGQTADCCHNLSLGALSSRSALSVLVGALFKKFGSFLNTPRILLRCFAVWCHLILLIYTHMFRRTCWRYIQGKRGKPISAEKSYRCNNFQCFTSSRTLFPWWSSPLVGQNLLIIKASDHTQAHHPR